MNTIEILKAARAKIEVPENWCKDMLAFNADGKAVMPWEEDACRWCPLGAIDATVPVEGDPFAPSPARMALAGQVELESPLNLQWMKNRGIAAAIFNNRKTTTHADILALFDRAIAAEEAM